MASGVSTDFQPSSLVSKEKGIRRMTANLEINAQVSPNSAAHRELNNHQHHANATPSIYGFDCWWQKTLAQHMAMAAEASALMHAHRRVSAVGQQCGVGQPH